VLKPAADSQIIAGKISQMIAARLDLYDFLLRETPLSLFLCVTNQPQIRRFVAGKISQMIAARLYLYDFLLRETPLSLFLCVENQPQIRRFVAR
jgi:hypothetical protein